VTSNLAIEDSDKEVVSILSKIKSNHPGPLPPFFGRDDYDWCLISIDVTRKDDPVEGTLYVIQHFGKAGDSGYVAYVLKDVFKNRHELDQIIKILEHHHSIGKATGETGTFHLKCAEMVKGLRLGTSLFELSKKGILHTPPPTLN
jgi:hypothetical protein